MNLQQNTRHPLHGFRMAVCWLTANARVNPGLTARSRAPQLLVPSSLENSSGRMNHLRSILYSMLHVLDVTECCSISRRFQIPPRYKKSKGIEPGQRAGNSVRPPGSIHFYRNTLFENPPTARRNCGVPMSCLDHKWFLVCSSKSSNSYGRTFLCKSWQTASSQTWWK